MYRDISSNRPRAADLDGFRLGGVILRLLLPGAIEADTDGWICISTMHPNVASLSTVMYGDLWRSCHPGESRMDLNTLANLAEIIGVVTIVGGLWFAVIELMNARRQRRDMATIELARVFDNPEFDRALLLVLSLPSGIGTEELG
jgi:hypothetical protein